MLVVVCMIETHGFYVWLLHVADDSTGHNVVGAHDWCLGLVLLLTVRGHYMRLMLIVGCRWLTLAVVSVFGIHGWRLLVLMISIHNCYVWLDCSLPLVPLSATNSILLCHLWAMILLVMSLYMDVPFIFVLQTSATYFSPEFRCCRKYLLVFIRLITSLLSVVGVDHDGFFVFPN